MNKKLFLVLVTSLLLVGCERKTQDSSPTSNDNVSQSITSNNNTSNNVISSNQNSTIISSSDEQSYSSKETQSEESLASSSTIVSSVSSVDSSSNSYYHSSSVVESSLDNSSIISNSSVVSSSNNSSSSSSVNSSISSVSSSSSSVTSSSNSSSSSSSVNSSISSVSSSSSSVTSSSNSSSSSSSVNSSISSVSSSSSNVSSSIISSSSNSNSSNSSTTSSTISSSVINSSSSNIYNGTYYNSISNHLTGSSLQSSLQKLLESTHDAKSYSSLWTAYKTTDIKPGTNYIWDMYSNYNYVVGTDQAGNFSAEGQKYNREHSIPKSWFNDEAPMYSDIHHLFPTDGFVNGKRSNFPYGEVGEATYTSKNGSKLGSSSFSGYSGTVFEPIDEYKGDFARTYFYFATRYQGVATSGNGSAVFKKTYPYLTDYALNLFTKWSEMDPISQKEIDRNNAAQDFQGNRNPFIDHPEYINKIFGGNTSIDDDVNHSSSSSSSNSSSSSSSSSSSIGKTDQEYANEVINLINNIGTIDESSKSRINAASNAYNALTSSQKALVTNYPTLTQAIEEYENLYGESINNQVQFTFKYDSNNKKSFTDNGITFNSNIDSYAQEARGVQFTNSSISKASNKTLKLFSSDYEGGITSLKINIATNGKTDSSAASIKVSIGGVQLNGDVSTINKDSNTDYIFSSETELKGEILIEITTSQTNKSVYINSLTIN